MSFFKFFRELRLRRSGNVGAPLGRFSKKGRDGAEKNLAGSVGTRGGGSVQNDRARAGRTQQLETALVATMPGWVEFMIERDELNLDDPSSAAFKTRPVETKAELLRSLEEGASKARVALQDTTDEHLMKPWRFVIGGRVVYEPRYVVLVNGVFSHLAHHRGQLTVYLRLIGATLPALYGPSADEQS